MPFDLSIKRTHRIIGIVGSRRRNSLEDRHKLFEEFDKISERSDWIVSGGCPKGGDRFAEELARQEGRTIIIYHADWIRYPQAAGFMRNSDIAEMSDILIALVAEDRTGGTEDTIKKTMKLNKQIIII